MNRRNNGNRNENDGNGIDGGSSLWQTAAAAAAVAAGTVAVVGGLGYLLTKGSTTSSVSQASAQTDEHEQRGFLDSLADSLQDVDNSNQVNMERTHRCARAREIVKVLPLLSAKAREGINLRELEKLRDAQGMKGIASYHIKTLFFWEVLDKKNIDPTFWQRSDIATLFKHMLQKFYEALEKQNIPYFWNKKNNMIEDLNTNLVNEDKRKLIDLLKVLLQNPCDHKLVARYLLTSEEYQEYQSFL